MNKFDALRLKEDEYNIHTIEFDGQELTYREFERISYVENPVEDDCQRMSIFVPEKYYQGETVGRYSKETAPVLIPNTVGGYMPGYIERPGRDVFGRINLSFFALLRGYVVVSPGLRGRNMTGAEGEYLGTAPAVVCDMKAVIRYLRHNKDIIPGNMERIITNGTSAGGALSAITGASGNHSDYVDFMKQLGAARERDDIYAASCYCPITNLDHADMAYEWEFYGQTKYTFPEKGVLTAE